MRYLPLDESDRRGMLQKIGVADIDALFAVDPRRQTPERPARPAAGDERTRGRAPAWRAGGEEPRGRRRAVLPRRRRLSPPRAGERRSSDPALGVPDQLHALSAGDLAGHAAGAVRIPDPGRGADRHGGRQRLDVRRLDRLRRGDADGAPPDAAAARRCSRAACIRNMPMSPRRSPRWPATRSCACRPTRMRDEDIAAADRQRRPPASSCRARISSAIRAISRAIAEAAHAKGALLIAVFTEVVSLGALQSPGAMGADIVVGEGQSIGNALSFGGPYVGLFATRLKYVRQMPGRARRRDGRRGRTARLRADALDARTAHPAREGDEQHLHQLRPLRARLLDPHDAARRDRAAASGAGQSRQRGRSRRAARGRAGRRGAQQTFLQRIHHPHAAAGRRTGRRSGARAASSPACRSRGCCPTPGSTTSSSSPPPRPTRPKIARPTPRRCAPACKPESDRHEPTGTSDPARRGRSPRGRRPLPAIARSTWKRR